MRLIAIALGIGVIAAFAAGVEDEVRAAEQRWANAVKGADAATLQQIFTPGLIYAHASGAIESKEIYLTRLKSGKQKYDSINLERTLVVPYGNSAVSHSIARMTGRNDRGRFDDHVMMMHVWVKQKGKWRLAAHQTTKIE